MEVPVAPSMSLGESNEGVGEQREENGARKELGRRLPTRADGADDGKGQKAERRPDRELSEPYQAYVEHLQGGEREGSREIHGSRRWSIRGEQSEPQQMPSSDEQKRGRHVTHAQREEPAETPLAAQQMENDRGREGRMRQRLMKRER